MEFLLFEPEPQHDQQHQQLSLLFQAKALLIFTLHHCTL
jgi:hypothetical protein